MPESIVMGTSTSKGDSALNSGTVRDDNDPQQPSSSPQTGGSTKYDQCSTLSADKEEPVIQKKYKLSAIGKKTSFYETVDANEVLPYLIIGNMASAKDSSFLIRKNIKFVLNLTSDPVEETVEGIEYKTIPMEDDEDEQLSPHLVACFEFINKANPACIERQNDQIERKQETKSSVVLVHSYFGMSRAAAVVLAYLMKKKGMTLRQSYDHLKECHGTANPNENFIIQLLRLEQELNEGRLSMTLKDFYH